MEASSEVRVGELSDKREGGKVSLLERTSLWNICLCGAKFSAILLVIG